MERLLPANQSQTVLQSFAELCIMECQCQSTVRSSCLARISHIDISSSFNVVADENWSRQRFVARPLSKRWRGKLQPLLAINSSRLLLAAGNMIYSYGFSTSKGPSVSPPVHLECAYTVNTFRPNRDITALASIPDGSDQTAFIGYADGILEKVTLPHCGELRKTSGQIDASLRERYSLHNDAPIECLSATSSHVLSLSSSGTAALLPLNTTSPTPDLIDLDSRGWSCYLSTSSSTPYAAFGTTSFTPLSVHAIRESQLSARPSLYLTSSTEFTRATAVYAISAAPPGYAWGASDQILASGWYDGIVRIYDLRTRTYPTEDAPSLAPCMVVSDPWSPEPIYSLSCGGGGGAHIAAGSARHSVVAFWDVRAPARGWSVHAPGNESSPVYSVVTDGARVFGANESRGFVFDFGGGVGERTYPEIAIEEPASITGRWRRTGGEQLKRAKDGGAGFYVTKYSHNKY